ncbi:YhcN/YlaJ family sporulation lipoprotein [Alkalihalobacillus sp. MEB130]|uniref:YhcN/YlaJ family sporulation lipoprotein n=1 Tax=Alkalihalobacillus sp. MEB130 TaxID=2976704 RepID=UPI0028DE7489|nr:YhcN/YlaJ family sporulation lipoprotein [Alkalihalobacillus sp. MEB130]MDT8861199.1 YhcN/YlaJ family sporulation lipoprotein [Alkalihalobacillus sp. MEB130]
MKKFMISLTTATMLISGLSACAGTHDASGDEESQVTAQAGEVTPSLQTQNHTTYHHQYEAQAVEGLAHHIQSLNGVKDAHVVIHEENVLIGITTNEDPMRITAEVEQTAAQFINRDFIQVVTDQQAVERICKLDHELRNGTAFNKVGANFNDILNDLAAPVRPDEGSL